MSIDNFDILEPMYRSYVLVLSVGAFIFDAKRRLLVVKKSPHEKVDADLWTIPGGKIYPQEHILEGLRREIFEEVGLEITSPEWIGEDVFCVQNIPFHAEHFMCKAKNTSVVLEKKLTNYKWIGGIEEMKKLAFPKNIEKRIVEIFTKSLL